MENQDLFHKNIYRWSKKFPRIALRLQYLNNVFTSLDYSNPTYPNLKKENRFYYEKDPLQEARIWFETLDLTSCNVLYVYGVGLGYYYEAIKPWLKENSQRNLVFLEDDLEVLYCLFHTENGFNLLHDPQVTLFYFHDLKEKDSFDELYWDFILTEMSVSALKFYEEIKEEKYLELKHRIVHDAAIKNALVDEYLRFGASFFCNFYPNMLLLPESCQGTKLYGKFQNIPAIICGAGPSLEKNRIYLKDYLDNAIVFAGGSALNALTCNGIMPHFGIGVDPNSTQQYRLSSNKAYEVPLFYRNRMHHEAFKLVHGPKLYIPGAGGYEVADWFDEQLGLLEGIQWLDEGHNVVNFALELAKNLGCNPILLVGVDLGFTEYQTYASGIIDDSKIDIDDLLKSENFDLRPFLKKDIDGNPIYTLWKWVAESEWIGEYAKANPELTIINTTEGGLGMPGIPNRIFKEVAEECLQRSYDLRTRVQGEIINSSFSNITNSKMLEMMEELNLSLKRSLDYISTLIKDKIEYEKKLLETKTIPKYTQSGLAALAEIELEEEPSYEHIIGIFNLVYSRILNREIQNTQENQNMRDEYLMELEKNKINLKRLLFMQDVARVNIYIIENAIEERKKQLQG